MSLQEIYDDPKVSVIEEKFELIRDSETHFTGKYPLEPFARGARGTYGGEFACQALRAAWESISDPDFHPHSFHSYFLKAGSMDSVMTYEVEATSDGRNFCLRLVRCYQLGTSQLCYILMASFTRNNYIKDRQDKFAELLEEQKLHPRTKVPVEFSRKPNGLFDKYINQLDKLVQIEHTNGNLVHAIPRETGRPSKKDAKVDPARMELGAFFKVNDNLAAAKDQLKGRVIDLTFASDSFYLSTMLRTLGFALADSRSTSYFRVSLDHSVFFHDIDFDPTRWMFIDYRFNRLSNDRTLVLVSVFTDDKRLVATITQEALAIVPLKTIEKARPGSYKL